MKSLENLKYFWFNQKLVDCIWNLVLSFNQSPIFVIRFWMRWSSLLESDVELWSIQIGMANGLSLSSSIPFKVFPSDFYIFILTHVLLLSIHVSVAILSLFTLCLIMLDLLLIFTTSCSNSNQAKVNIAWTVPSSFLLDPLLAN